MVQRGEQRGADVNIEDADVLVAGGRGLGKPEGFELVEQLAKAFGGDSAVAATRAVVDAGWYPYAAQIGQTGKTVAPKLYLAAGISGAIQHKVGMQSSENIVAINKDSNAPIFEFSDLGIVGDLNKIVPKLTEAVKAKKGGLVSRNGRAVAPAQFPPPVDSQQEFIKRELDDEDERIEVGVAIVGGGPAGLACANRLLQLLADEPELMERLGEVPVAVDREGQGLRRPQPVGRDDAPVGPAGALPRPRARTGRPMAGRQGLGLLDAQPQAGAAAQADAAAVSQPWQPRRLGRRAVALAGREGRGGRRLHPHRDRGLATARRGRRRARDPLGRQGPRQGRRAAGQLRARRRRRRQGHRPRRGDVGAT